MVFVAILGLSTSAFVSGFMLTSVYLVLGVLMVLRWGLSPHRRARAINLLLPMVALVLMGVIGSIGAGHEANFIRRDIWTFGRAIVAVWLGFMIGLRIGPAALLRAAILSGLIVAGWHIGRVLTNLSVLQSDTANVFRGEIGRGFVHPAIAVAVVLNSYRWRASEVLRLPTIVSAATVILSVASIVLSFSRTMFTVTIMLAVLPLFVQLLASASGGVRAGIRSRRMFILTLGAASVVMVILPMTSAGRDFGEKIGTSISELTGSNFETKADITQSFRSYERQQAFTLYDTGSGLEKLVGFGFGQTIDLELTLDFGGDVGEFRYVPVLHDGFSMTLIKVGALGLLVYVLWHGYIWVVGRRLRAFADPSYRAFGEIQMYGVAALVLVTPSVAGALNTNSFDTLLVLFGAGYAYWRLGPPADEDALV